MIECSDCGLIQETPILEPGQWASCGRCGAVLSVARTPDFQAPFALGLTALLMLGLACALPFLEFAYRGRRIQSFIVSGIEMLLESGFGILSFLVAFTILLAPLMVLSALLVVSFQLWRGRAAHWTGRLYRVGLQLRPWAMLEVFLLGALVAVIKLGQLADVVMHFGFYCFVAVVPLMLLALDRIDPNSVWRAVDRAQGRAAGMALGPGALSCPVCALRSDSWGETRTCPRCGERLERRKAFAIQRSVALLLAAAILYVPANLLPVLRLDLMGRTQADTILEGVQSLIAGGLWEVAALVFFASFLVPGLKILGLAHLAVTLRHSSAAHAVQRTRLYRLVDNIGRWSMIDVFMTAVLVGLVQLGAIATIVPGAGATCFAAVVVLTIFAADHFEPRAIWDRLEESKADG